ncbi:MAG: hypothetical protein R6V02_00590 [Candidatus Aminicenantes bacterium]
MFDINVLKSFAIIEKNQVFLMFTISHFNLARLRAESHRMGFVAGQGSQPQALRFASAASPARPNHFV